MLYDVHPRPRGTRRHTPCLALWLRRVVVVAVRTARRIARTAARVRENVRAAMYIAEWISIALLLLPPSVVNAVAAHAQATDEASEIEH